MSLNNENRSKSIAFSQIQDRETLKKYLFNYSSKLQHVRNLITYTRFDNLIKIVKDKKWRLGNPLNMNDLKELSDFPRADWSRIFYACFMADTPESIAMWSMYGRPWADGVSITIDRKTFSDWISQCKKFYRKDGDTFYEISGTSIQVVRIAYTNELTKGPTDPISIVCGSSENNIIDNIFSDDASYDSTAFAGLIKDNAWSYEKEIRVRADYLGPDVPDAIYIDVPDHVINSMVITCGPLFYGNLEHRIRTTCNMELRLNYSQYISKLNGMPCAEYFSVNNTLSDCKERLSLIRAQSTIADAENLYLHSYSGRGTAEFKNRGTLSIGTDDYFFPIKWKRDGKKIYLEGKVGRNKFGTNIPAANTLYSFDFYPEDNTSVEGKAVLVVNENGRVAAIKISSVNSDDILSFEYRIFCGSTIRFNYSEKYYENKEKILSYDIPSEDQLCGTWWDEKSQRCHMSICKKDNRHFVTINWSSSAVINTEWTMSGEWDGDKKEMVFDNECRLTEKGYFDNPNIELITEYENGSGRIYIEGDKLYWEDATKKTGKQCMFKKAPFPGIQKI